MRFRLTITFVQKWIDCCIQAAWRYDEFDDKISAKYLDDAFVNKCLLFFQEGKLYQHVEYCLYKKLFLKMHIE